MVAVNTLLCFLLPTVLVIGTAVGGYVDTSRELNQEESSRENEDRCPPNEHYDLCLAGCQTNCSNVNELPRICPLSCVRGCVCNRFLIRGPDGKCIKPEECPGEIKCPEGERYERCGAKCEKNCFNWNRTDIPCPYSCFPGCVCKDGTVRDVATGKCVPPKECPVRPLCPRGEHFDRCSYHCQKNCTNFDQELIPCTKDCVPGCVCDKGTVRSSLPNGKCIDPKTCPPKEEIESAHNEEEDSQEDIQSIEESEEDSSGIFPWSRYCPPNEEFVPCHAHWEPHCKKKHVFGLGCVSGCRCKKGYVRGPEGTCIRPKKCPANDTTKYPVKRVCPRVEHWDDSTAHCQGNCSTNSDLIPCFRISVGGCICNEGLRRRDDGVCVPINKCPKKHETPEAKKEEERSQEDESSIEESEDHLNGGLPWLRYCPPNEEFVPCKAHFEPHCKKKHVFGLGCVSGCRCQKGYVRGPKGTCIRPKKCPRNDTTIYPVKRVCPRVEHWDDSTAHCRGNCSTNSELIPCFRISVGGCICNKGLRRRDDGVCVPIDKCPKKHATLEDELLKQDESKEESFCPENEFFVPCFSHCEQDCKHKNQTSIPCKRSICVSSCRCKWGFLRGPKGTCIKPEQCPSNDDTKYPVERECPKNEHWDKAEAHCKRNCTTLDKLIPPCVDIIVPGCVCDEGLYRGKDGKCVPRDQCPKTTEDEALKQDELIDQDKPVDQGQTFCPKNEVFVACYAHCEQDCKNKNQTVPPCNRNLCVSSCRCYWGFVRGPDGTCIKPSQCPPKDNTTYPVKRVCPSREHWETSTAHCQKNCTNIAKPPPCLKIRQAGCVCDAGLLRAKDGKCVTRDQCPKTAEDVIDDTLPGESSEEPVSGYVCPNERLCYRKCQRLGRRGGRCVGRGQRRCICF